MKPQRILTFGILTGLLVFGVAAKKRDYMRVYNKQTDELVIYRKFATALKARGTYLSDEFRQALVHERERLLGLTESDTGFETLILEDGEKYHEIVFSADSSLEEGDDFGDSDKGWHLTLLADGVKQPLVEIYKVRRPNPVQRALYPHFNLWSDLWIARFEKKNDKPASLQLRFGSGYGHGTMDWGPKK